MTLEEIGRRAVALTEARSEYLAHGTCEIAHVAGTHPDDPGEFPCWVESDDREEWCDGCKRREGLLEAKRNASRALSIAVNTYRRAVARGERP